MKILRFILLSFICLPLTINAQQDPLYSQYMFNMLAINPAYTGIHNNLNISVSSRFQWGGLDGSPKTNILTASTSLLDHKIGIGAIILRDELGVNENTEGYLSYSYKITSADYTLSFGLQSGFVNYSYNYNDLTLRFLDDPSFTPVSEGLTRFNFGAGAAFMSDKLFLGFSSPRLMNKSFSDGVIQSTRYERHYYLTGAYLLELRRGIKFKPMALIKAVSGAPISFDLNFSIFLNNKLWAGIFTRDFNTYGLMGQIEFMDAYKFGYSFEIPSGDFIANDLLTHELMLSIDLAIFSEHDVFQHHF